MNTLVSYKNMINGKSKKVNESDSKEETEEGPMLENRKKK